MQIETGYLYHIKNEFFDIINENVHSRLSYLAFKYKDILWFISLSLKVGKYESICI